MQMAAGGEAGGGKVGAAAAMGVMALALSIAMAGGSAFLLWRGDIGDDMVNTLPRGCEAVALVPAPAELRRIAAGAGQWRGLPTPLQPLAVGLQDAVTTTLGTEPMPGLDEQAGIGVCWTEDGSLTTLGIAPGGIDALLGALAARIGKGQWRPAQPVGGFVEYQLVADDGKILAAALAGERRLQLVRDAADPTPRLAALVRKVQSDPMRGDVLVRAAIERIGAGALQLVLGGKRTRATAERIAPLAPLATFGRDHARFLAVSLRDDLDDGRVHAHVHVGVGEDAAGEVAVATLKRALDPGVTRPSSAALKGLTAGGVVRLGPAAWTADAAGRAAAEHLPGASTVLPLLAPQGGLEALSGCWEGTVVWGVAAAGQPPGGRFAAFGLRDGKSAPAGAVADARWWVVSPDGEAVARAALAHLAAHPAADPAAQEDRARILDDTQGFFVQAGADALGWGLGQAALEGELIWLDTGLVLHLGFTPSGRR